LWTTPGTHGHRPRRGRSARRANGDAVFQLRMSAADLRRMRFAYSPLAEVTESLYMLSHEQVPELYRVWFEMIRGSLGRVDMPLLRVVMPPGAPRPGSCSWAMLSRWAPRARSPSTICSEPGCCWCHAHSPTVSGGRRWPHWQVASSQQLDRQPPTVRQDQREFTEFYATAWDDCLRIVALSMGNRQLAEDLVAGPSRKPGRHGRRSAGLTARGLGSSVPR